MHCLHTDCRCELSVNKIKCKVDRLESRPRLMRNRFLEFFPLYRILFRAKNGVGMCERTSKRIR